MGKPKTQQIGVIERLVSISNQPKPHGKKKGQKMKNPKGLKKRAVELPLTHWSRRNRRGRARIAQERPLHRSGGYTGGKGFSRVNRTSEGAATTPGDNSTGRSLTNRKKI